ncbi:MAG: class I SAM-dependent methyltransferase [Spirochaetes bacterium]|nr:class I SAM-dependent methyltransferase [Spirochaetota bacterium]
MQTYQKLFAYVYNRYWSGFSLRVAPFLLDFFNKKKGLALNRTLLDLCCGTGQMINFFCSHNYEVTGIDLSSDMLSYAKENNQEYLKKGKTRFLNLDATGFRLDMDFSFVVSIFDALNHFENFDQLHCCFESVFSVLKKEGYFVFDLNTQLGLNSWNKIQIDEGYDLTLICRGVFSKEMDRAYTRVTGFVRGEKGNYQRFEETVYNTPYVLTDVEKALKGIGFSRIYFAQMEDLEKPLSNPENYHRVFVVCKK